MLGRRPDGYHELDSLVVFAGAGDRLEAASAEALTLDIAGPFAGAFAGEADNLVLRAARVLAQEAGVPAAARLRLDKRLPVASGIGGGSADAAAALRLLARLWDVQLPADRLARLAARLGADVPVCLAATHCRMQGAGERLLAAPRLPAFGLALVNPGIAVATADVFRARAGAFSPPARLPDGWPSAAAMAADLAALRNDLEAPAIALCPPIGDALAALRGQPGCLHAAMSGSGATCYGLFARTDEVALVGLPAGWWRWPS